MSVHLAQWELLCHSPCSLNRYRDTDIDLPLGKTHAHTHVHTRTHTQTDADAHLTVWLLQAVADGDIKRNCGDGLRVPALSHQISLTIFDHALFLLSFTPLLSSPFHTLHPFLCFQFICFRKPPHSFLFFFSCNSHLWV